MKITTVTKYKKEKTIWEIRNPELRLPDIDIKVKIIEIKATTRKLKVIWTPESVEFLRLWGTRAE